LLGLGSLCLLLATSISRSLSMESYLACVAGRCHLSKPPGSVILRFWRPLLHISPSNEAQHPCFMENLCSDLGVFFCRTWEGECHQRRSVDQRFRYTDATPEQKHMCAMKVVTTRTTLNVQLLQVSLPPLRMFSCCCKYAVRVIVVSGVPHETSEP